MSGTHEAAFYVQLRPIRNRWTRGIDHLTAIRVSRRKPDPVEPGCIAIKLKIRVPDAAFEPLSPEAVIDVPLDLIQRPVAVEAVDPS